MQAISWRPNWIVQVVTSWVRVRHTPGQTSAILALLLFVFYWVVPGILATIEGTFVDPNIVNSGLNRLSELTGFVVWHVPEGETTGGHLLFYTSDSTHFLFTVCLIVGVYVGNTMFDRIESFLNDLRRAGSQVTPEDESAIRKLYCKFQSLFRSPSWAPQSIIGIGFRIAAVFVALFVFAFFNRLCRRSCVDPQMCWWGQSGYGLAGTYYSFVIAALVYLVTEALGSVLLGAAMIDLILRNGYVKPNLFAQDLANGLSPVGDLVLLGVIASFVGSIAVFIVLRVGYFGVENLIVIWGLIIIATLFVPLATLIPIYSAISLISDAKYATLQNINILFDAPVSDKASLAATTEWIRNIQPAISVYKHVSELNALPFNKHKAYISVVALALIGGQTIVNFIKLLQ